MIYSYFEWYIAHIRREKEKGVDILVKEDYFFYLSMFDFGKY